MRILVADHHHQLRRAMCRLIELKTRHVLVGEAVDRSELLEQTTKRQPNLVLLDWELPGHARNNIIPELQELESPPRVVVLSTRIEVKEEALGAGADAFVTKSDPPEKLFEALALMQTHQ